jgi:signal transduction histidine kinase
VHDVAGHGFAVIAMQAGVALRAIKDDRAAHLDGVRTALEGIRATSREALEGLRAEIEALQQGQDAPLRPGSGLADLPALVDRIRSSGLPLTVHNGRDAHDGYDDEMPVEVDRAAYRIVQESLTNVLRHAGADVTAWIDIRREGGALRIEVTDTGRGGLAGGGFGVGAGEGRGIAGMRARAEMLGGTLDAGPAPGGGFTVRATLPLDTTVSGAPS